jgi:hypothetical protein
MMSELAQQIMIYGGALTMLVAGSVALRKLIVFAYRTTNRIVAAADLILHELMPNGGSSLADAVHRIDHRVEILEAWRAEIQDGRERSA